MRLFIAFVSIAPALALGQVVINPTGGLNSNDGIRVTVGGTGQVQVLRSGSGQLYNPSNTATASTNGIMTNGVYLAVGNTVTGPMNFATSASSGIALQEWTPLSNTVTPQGNGGTATTVLRATVAGRNYDLTVTWQYLFPNEFVVVTHSLQVPAGNTATVRLYHVADAFLGGDDFGPSFASIGPPALVGGYRPASNIVEAWRYRSGPAWTGYFAGFYWCLFDASRCPVGQNNSVNSATTFTNYVEPTTVDNSFGIMWNFGSSAGTYVTQNDLTFYSYQPQLSKRFGTTAVTAPSSTTLTFTIDNVPGALPQSSLGFTDTFPSGLVLANGTVSNTCGGTVTTAGGAALATGSSSVRLTGASFASGVTRCTLTVNVTSSTSGAYTNGAANISGLSVLENQVTDQTLSVVMGAPVVRLDPPGTINATNTTAYRVQGSCQDTNGVVTVRVSTISTTTPCSGNRFSTTLAVSALSDGGNIPVSASQTNGAGAGTDSSTTTKDTTVPGVPIFTAPASGGFVSTSTPTISGTGEVGTTVRVFAGGTEVCSAVVSASGTWSCVGTTLPEGATSLTVRATDPAGNSGTTSPGRTITIDTVPPDAPVITNPAASSTVAPDPSVSGTSEASSTVLVFEGTTQLCSTPADASGQWSCPTTLGTGSHDIYARQIDRANNSGPNSGARTFAVANVPTVTLDTPGPINAANATTVTIAGSCTTAAGLVTVRVASVQTTTPCTAGRFSTSLNASGVPDDAVIPLSAAQTNLTGTGTDTRNTVKDTIPPMAPMLSTPADGSFTNTTTPTFTGTGEPGSTVRVTRGAVELCSTTVPSTGMWACTSSNQLPGTITVTARATDAAENPSSASPARTFTIDSTAPVAPTISTPAPGASVAPQPTLTGTAEPLAMVTVFEGSGLVCSVTADATGAWTCTTSLGAGPHSVVARQTDRAGNASPASAPRSFEVQGLPAVLLNTPVDITSANASAYVVTGACTVTAGMVSVAVGTTTASVPCAGGHFSATLDVRSLNDAASVLVRASQTTAAGTGSDMRTVKKDTSAPSNTVVTEPAGHAVLTSSTPTISGTGEPGATVVISVNGNVVGSAVVDASGAWQFTPPVPLADGSYVVTVTARDTSGNESTTVSGPTFTVDSNPPAAPVIVAPVDGSQVDSDRRLEVSGVAEASSAVTLYVDGSPVGGTTADAQGRFFLALEPGALSAMAHVLEADARDAAGNLSARSEPVRLTVHLVDERFAGQGLGAGCSAMDGSALMILAALLARRGSRREARR